MPPAVDIALQIALLLSLGLACQWLAWRMRVPAILPLLLTGMLLGPGLNLLNPEHVQNEIIITKADPAFASDDEIASMQQ